MHKLELTDKELNHVKACIHWTKNTCKEPSPCKSCEDLEELLKKLDNSNEQESPTSPSKPLRWFLYNQNNSGGDLVKDDKVDNYVFIEAHSPTEANEFAEKLGIYFDGCEKEIDCECCGDRWTACWKDEQGTETVELYGKPLDETRASRSKIWNYETLRKL